MVKLPTNLQINIKDIEHVQVVNAFVRGWLVIKLKAPPICWPSNK